MAVRSFPENISPTSRSYRPGRLPETKFQALNGAVSFVQYGQNFVDAELTLNFANINDDKVLEILQHYSSVVGDDYVRFGRTKGFQGMAINLVENGLENGTDLLRWRYKEPPQVQSVYPGISSVQLAFIGVLYGA
jgi:hypothetical protein